MHDLITSGEVDDMEAEMWLTSLAFVSQPSSEMIREVAPLLKSAKPTRKMYLSISTLVNSYCRQNEDCDFNQDVQQVKHYTLHMHTLSFQCSVFINL
jgi:hypothetical protein